MIPGIPPRGCAPAAGGESGSEPPGSVGIKGYLHSMAIKQFS